MTRVALAALALGLISVPALASETPRAGFADPRVRTVNYDPEQVYRIVGVFRTATQVLFPAMPGRFHHQRNRKALKPLKVIPTNPCRWTLRMSPPQRRAS